MKLSIRPRARLALLLVVAAVVLVPLASLALIQNQYIQLSVGSSGNFTIFGNAGSVASPSWQRIIYGSGSTSFTTICVDGNDSHYQGSAFTQQPTDNNPTAGSNTSAADFAAGAINVTQTLSVVMNPATGKDDLVRIAYRVTNNDSASHDVGVRIMIDTMLAGNDAAPIWVPGVGRLDNEAEFIGSDVPTHWQAFDGTDPSNSTIISSGSLIGGGATKPDRFVIANWGSIDDTSWDYSVTPDMAHGDSAVAMYWNPATLAPGQTREYVTYYGLSELTVSSGNLGIWLDGPAALVVDPTGYGPNPFPVTAYITNNTEQTMSNVAATLSLPSGMWLDHSEARQSAANGTANSLEPGQTKPITWTVLADLQTSATTLTYYVDATARDANGNTVNATQVNRDCALPAVQLVTLPAATQQGGADVSAYRMVSFPLTAGTADAAAFLNGDLGGVDSSKWRLFEWTGTDYREATGAVKVLVRRGRGYWLICRDSVTFNNLRGATGTGEGPFVISLSQGWNLIGNPFDFPVAWSSVTATGVDDDPFDSGDTRPYAWLGANDYVRANILEPRRAYWVYVSGSSGQIAVPPTPAGDFDGAAATVRVASERTPPAPPGGLTAASSSSGGGCFIATAAYGSALEPHVQSLRRFRDTCLMTSGPGRAFVALYYRFSPPLAHYIEGASGLRAGARMMLLPLVVAAPLAGQGCWPLLALAAGVFGFARARRGRKKAE
jgi:hypothetical protein